MQSLKTEENLAVSAFTTLGWDKDTRIGESSETRSENREAYGFKQES